MIKVAIVEDEMKEREKLRSYFEKLEKEIGTLYLLSFFSDGDKFLFDFHYGLYDLVLMDIELSGKDNGITVSEKLRKIDTDVILVFMTNLAQYAIEGYKVNAVDYIVKPISYFDFKARISSLSNDINSKHKEKVLIQTDGKKIVVCSQCRLLYNYDTHLWLCPICKHRFKSDEQPQQDYPKSANRNASRDEMKDVIRAFKSESGNKTDRPNPTRNDLGKINRVITYGKEVSDFLSKDNKEAKMEISPSRPRINSNKEDLRKDLHINLSNKNIQEQKVPFPKKEKLDTFNCEDYTITRQIGQGTFGKIYEVVDKKNKTFAMKKILTNSMEEINAITNEYMMLKSLSSYKLNLVNIYAIQIKQLDKTTQAMYILMDLAVRDWEKEIEIRGIKKHFYSESELIKILKELTHTFAELQRHNISHRDIKPQNILLLQDKSFRIADFGEAKRVIQSNKRTVRQTIRGTELYMSPILFHALKEKGKTDYYTVHNTFKSDVFSLGLCFLLAASLTFNSLISIRELEDMLSIKVRLAGYLQRYSTKFTDVLYNMIELDEKLRFDFVELEKYVENL